LAEHWPAAKQAGSSWFVIKGGAFITPADDVDLLAFFRAAVPGEVSTPYQGFRCVMDPPRQ
jgi:hypothetical protein